MVQGVAARNSRQLGWFQHHKICMDRLSKESKPSRKRFESIHRISGESEFQTIRWSLPWCFCKDEIASLRISARCIGEIPTHSQCCSNRSEPAIALEKSPSIRFIGFHPLAVRMRILVLQQVPWNHSPVSLWPGRTHVEQEPTVPSEVRFAHEGFRVTLFLEAQQ